MAAGVEVLGRVLVLRAVAAADMAALHAQAQVHPRVARLQAVLTPLGSVGLDFPDARDVNTQLLAHFTHLPPPRLPAPARRQPLLATSSPVLAPMPAVDR